MHLLCPVYAAEWHDMRCDARSFNTNIMQPHQNEFVRAFNEARPPDDKIMCIEVASMYALCTEAKIEFMRRERDMETNKPTHTVQGTHARVDRLPVNNFRFKKQRKPSVLDETIFCDQFCPHEERIYVRLHSSSAFIQ